MEELGNNGSLYVPIVSITELKPAMDAVIQTLGLDRLFVRFLNMFFEHKEECIGENEEKNLKIGYRLLYRYSF